MKNNKRSDETDTNQQYLIVFLDTYIHQALVIVVVLKYTRVDNSRAAAKSLRVPFSIHIQYESRTLQQPNRGGRGEEEETESKGMERGLFFFCYFFVRVQ